MNIKKINPRVSLNKAFIKKPVGRREVELFKKNLKTLLSQVDSNQSEEFNKNLLSSFLRETYYSRSYFINTNDRTDLVIHKGKNSSFPVSVMIETKNPSNKAEMPTADNLNVKAFQELLLYYLRERITKKNIEIKHLIISNVFEWFIFDSVLFEKEFANNKELVRLFIDFENENQNTSFFYNEIAREAINRIERDISFTYFDLRDYERAIKSDDAGSDNSLIPLYKIFSPEHLLKLPFSNDSNTLDKAFYSELLHIIGLAETKDGGKKIIGRKKDGERNLFALIENAITNAVIHRDYYMKRDIEINIYEDRVEVISSGLFPYNITPSNIGFVRSEGYRNDLLVKHLREFPEPPNLDRNEGVRAMRAEMNKNNLYPPVYITYPIIKDSVCCVLLNAERTTEWDKVYSYLSKTAKYISNEDVRKIIGNEDTVKVSRFLKKWVDQGLLTKIDTGAKKTAKYRLPSGEMTDYLFADSKCK